MRNFKTLLLVAILFVSATVMAQTKLTGVVVDEANEPLPGASVYEKGTSNGTQTDFDGKFALDAKASSGTLVISFIGFDTVEIQFSASKTNLGTIQLKEGGNLLEEVVIVGKGVIDLAGGRKTPIAVNTIKAAEIQTKLGTQDVTMTLANTPSVYVAGAAGGFGDSRINVRGFDQTNTAYLLNGQPINSMEDGRMFWSNWQGLNDVASAIQIQRGLGASKLAISSVGGTVNFVTRATDRRESGYASATIANNNFVKTTFNYSTGMSDKGFGTSVMLTHWQGDGYMQGNFGKGQTYFISFGYKPNESHNFNFLITGAPQWHDQAFNERISDYLQYGRQYNGNWGTLRGEYLTSRRNFYHKPVANLNWDWTIDEDTNLSTVLYASWGRGGGTGPRGNGINTADGSQVDFDAIYNQNIQVPGGAAVYFGPNPNYIIRASMNLHAWYGLVTNFNKQINENLSFNVGMDLRTYYGEHFRVVENFLGLRSWRENIRLRNPNLVGHPTIGGFGTYKFVNATRSYNADPWAATFVDIPEDQKINYSNDERISYGGVFAQLEYAKNGWTAFFQGALNNQWYQRFDHYQYVDQSLLDGTSPQWTGTPIPAEIAQDSTDSEKISLIGYNVKAGASYQINEQSVVYVNVGQYSRQPFFDNIFPSFTNQRSPLTENEDIFGLEAGYKYNGKNFSLNVDLYRTNWKGRVESVSRLNNGVVENTINFGQEQLHQGVEFELNYKPTETLSLRTFGSVNSWEYVGSTIQRVQDEDQNLVQPDQLNDVDGGKVGDAPQTSFGGGFVYRPNRNLSIDMDYRYFADLYARAGARKNNLQLPSYGVADAGISYRFWVGEAKTDNVRVRLNVNNVFHKIYISDLRTAIEATPGDVTYQGINVANQGIFGFGRTWNLSFRYNF